MPKYRWYLFCDWCRMNQFFLRVTLNILHMTIGIWKYMDASFLDINLLDFNSISSFGYIYTHTRFYFSAVTLHFEWASKLLFLWIVQKPTKHETHSRSNKYSKIESTQFKNQGRRLKTASRLLWIYLLIVTFIVSYFKK